MDEQLVGSLPIFNTDFRSFIGKLDERNDGLEILLRLDEELARVELLIFETGAVGWFVNIDDFDESELKSLGKIGEGVIRDAEVNLVEDFPNKFEGEPFEF